MSTDRRDPSIPDHTLTYEEGATGKAPAAAPAAQDRYVVGEEHARGGIGRILRARDLKLGRDVAIKELIRSDARGRARFAREARITARLEHPAIVPVHDAGTWDDCGVPYLAMKLVAGRSLKQAIAEADGLSARLALLPHVIAVAEAIGYAHSVGVIHRDLKPSNILVGDYGETVVIDWGLAKELDAGPDDDDPLEAAPYRRTGDQVTVAGAVVGTPAFMAPEQARGEPLDERADVYALGAVLYQTLSGRSPYEGSSQEIIQSVREREPAAVGTVEPSVPADLATIVTKAMARDPDRRYANGGALAADLQRYRNGQLVGAHRYSKPQLVARWMRRNRALTAVLALFLVAAVSGSAWFLSREQGLRRDAESARDRAEAERDRAESERDRADTQTLALLEKQGRIELAAGRPFRAAVYLAEALRREPTSSGPRWLVSEALRSLRARERALEGHVLDVVGVDMSLDGRLVATGGTDQTVRIWDRATGRSIHELQLGAPTEATAFSPDSRLVVAGGRGRTLVWDVETARVVHSLEVSGYRMAFSPDGAHLLIATKAGEVLLFDLSSQRVVMHGRHPEGRVSGVAWHPDGGRFFSVTDDGQVVLWDAGSRRRVRVFAHFNDPLSSVSVSPDGLRVLFGSYQEQYWIHDVETGRELTGKRLPDGSKITDVAYLGDGRTFVAGAIDGTVRVVHAASGQSLAAFDSMVEGRFNRLAVDASGVHLATVGVQGHALLWRLDGFGARVRSIGAGPDAGYVNACHWTDDGGLLAVGGSDGTLSVRHGATDAIVRTAQLGTSNSLFAVDDAGTRAISISDVSGQPPIPLWDLQSDARLTVLAGHRGHVYHVATVPPGTVAATAGGDGTIRQWSLATGEPMGPVLRSMDDRRFSSVAYSQDGRLIASADEAGLLQLWDRDTGALVRSIPAHTSWIQDIDFSHDSARVATAGRLDLTVRIWDVATGANLVNVPAQRGNVMVVRFSPDGSIVATAGTDNQLNIRDAASGVLLRAISGPRHCVAFHPTTGELVAGGPDEYLVSWDYEPDTRAPDQIHADVRRLSPWRLEEGRLVAEGRDAE